MMGMMITREAPNSPDASQLIAELDATLAPQYAPESRHGYSVDKLIQQGVHFFVLRYDEVPAGCGGVQFFGAEHEMKYAEVKRMFVRPQYRGLGLGKHMLDHLAAHTHQAGIRVLRLETGIYQTAAIKLYEREGFTRIPPFGSYWDDPVSLCYEKQLG